MRIRNIGIVISREYLNKVKKKSFIVTTFLVPILFTAMCLIPTLIMVLAKPESRLIAVADYSGIVMPKLEDGGYVSFVDCTGESLDSLKKKVGAEGGYDAVLSISALNPETKSVSASIYSGKPLSAETAPRLNRAVNDAVEQYRLDSYDIPELDRIMEEVKSDIRITEYTLDESGKEKITDSSVYMIVSMVFGMIIYMFIAMFGGMLMTSVIEEKSSRVIEVLISSVKATELMFGKIIGIALVALTQFLMWVMLTLVLVSIGGSIIGVNMLGGVDADAIMAAAGTDAGAVLSDPTASALLGTVMNLPVARLLVCFVLFFVFGYLLYASMFAAIGSAVENEADSQSLQIPVTIPILIAFFIALYANTAPDSAVVVWGSMIPFTSPIVMLARIPFGVPVWEIVLSMAILVATVGLFAWASAKIFKVGVLMFGKKTTWKDLWKWLRQN